MGAVKTKWFHVTFSTYGTWLPGDPRGYRTWKHTEHVEGDYRRPPSRGAHQNTLERSRRLLTRPPVLLSVAQRHVAGCAILEMLELQNRTVVALAVGAEHVHIVVQLPDDDARIVIGRAKKHAAHCLRSAGIRGGAWAKRCRTMPIRDRLHQLNAINYIKRHRKDGAFVWAWGEPRPAGTTMFPRGSARNSNSK